ncbi:MAG TPA: O-antigen ligase family protein [Methylomirabilota bacterium]|jgi:O-antigen ligase|nr:O-antigen ligase family protein [Methylomirabilota bacterium]
MAVADVLRGASPAERSRRRRLLDVLLVVLAVGLACSISLSEVTLAVMAAVLLVRARPGASWLRAPLAAPMLAFAGWTLVTAATAAQPADSLRSAKNLLVLATFWVVWAALPDAAGARRFASAVFVAVSVVSLLAIVQVAGCGPEGGLEHTPQVPLLAVYFKKCYRAHGFYSIYMTLAGVLTIVLALTLPRLAGFARRGLGACAWVGGAVALALTEVRGAWLAFAAGVATIVALGRRARLALVLVVLPLAALAFPHVQERLRSIVDPTDVTARERLVMLHVGLRLVREHPVAGIGPGQVKAVYPAYAPPDALRRHTSHLHNTPLQLVVERGLVGAALWIWIFVAFFRRAGRVLRRLPAEAAADRALVLGGLAGVTAFLIAGLFEYNFGDTEVLLVALSVMALPFVVERDLPGRAA